VPAHRRGNIPSLASDYTLTSPNRSKGEPSWPGSDNESGKLQETLSGMSIGRDDGRTGGSRVTGSMRGAVKASSHAGGSLEDDVYDGDREA
jgi:hypothetical protein